MSYVVQGGGDKYRGGYASSPVFDSEELREASSTFENYIGGTFLIIFLIFFTFVFLFLVTLLLMCYARYLNHRKAKGGFYNPPPMVTRYPLKINSGTYSTLPRSDYGSSMARTANSVMSKRHGAVSQQSMTEQSDVL